MPRLSIGTNVHFTLTDTVNSQLLTSRYAAYTTTDNIHDLRNSYVYYRLKISAHDGAVQYSKVIRLAWMGGNTADITLQPNPVRDHLQINMLSTADRDVQVLVYDVTGQLVKTMNNHVKKGYTTITLSDFRNCTKGVYTVKVLSGKELFVDRIVLVK